MTKSPRLQSRTLRGIPIVRSKCIGSSRHYTISIIARVPFDNEILSEFGACSKPPFIFHGRLHPCTIRWEDSSQFFLTFSCTSLLVGYEPMPLLCTKFYSCPHHCPDHFPYYLFAPAFAMPVLSSTIMCPFSHAPTSPSGKSRNAFLPTLTGGVRTKQQLESECINCSLQYIHGTGSIVPRVKPRLLDMLQLVCLPEQVLVAGPNTRPMLWMHIASGGISQNVFSIPNTIPLLVSLPHDAPLLEPGYQMRHQDNKRNEQLTEHAHRPMHNP